MTVSIAARRLVVLSGSQVMAMLATTAGGLATWLIAARLAPPAELGRASAIVALGTLVSGVVAAGAGQFLLAALPQRPSTERHRLMMRTVFGAASATAIVAAFVGWVAYADEPSVALLILVALSTTMLSTQDSVYLCANSARDVVVKALVVSALKPPIVVLAAGGVAMSGGGSSSLVLAIVLPTLAVGFAWQLVRAPLAVRAIDEPTAARNQRDRELFGVGYVYALSNSLVTLGVPALATNSLAPAAAALFYVAWTIASLLASVAASVANVVVARGQQAVEILKATPVVLAHAGFSLIVAAMTLLLAPLVLGIFGTFYQAAVLTLAVLLLGNVFSGTGAVLIGFARRTAPARTIALATSIWASGACGLPAFAALMGDSNVAIAYAIGAAAAMSLLVVVVRPASLGTKA